MSINHQGPFQLRDLDHRHVNQNIIRRPNNLFGEGGQAGPPPPGIQGVIITEDALFAFQTEDGLFLMVVENAPSLLKIQNKFTLKIFGLSLYQKITSWLQKITHFL